MRNRSSNIDKSRHATGIASSEDSKSATALGDRKTNKKHSSYYRSKNKPSKSTRKKPEIPAAPWAYKPELAHIARVICEIGATNYDLARAFNVDVMTIRKWQRTHKEFFNACYFGCVLRNTEVERTLMERACGYDATVVRVFRRKRHPIVVHYKKHIPPNVKASMFLLTNSDPVEWSMKPEPKPMPPHPDSQTSEKSDLIRLMEEIDNMRIKKD